MADQAGSLAGHERRRQTIAKAKKHTDPLNIIIIRPRGKPLSAWVEPRVLAAVAVCFLVLVAASVLIAARYATLVMENRRLERKVDELSAQLGHVAADPLWKTKEPAPDQKPETPKPEDTAGAAGGAGGSLPAADVTLVPPGDLDAPAVEEADVDSGEPEGAGDAPAGQEPVPAGEALVDVSRLSLVAADGGDSLRFKFSIRNLKPDNKQIDGYIVAVFINNKSTPPTITPYPDVELDSSGVPTDYSKGTTFSIRMGKTVRGVINGVQNASDFTAADVYVYSSDGQLLIKKQLTSNNG